MFTMLFNIFICSIILKTIYTFQCSLIRIKTYQFDAMNQNIIC